MATTSSVPCSNDDQHTATSNYENVSERIKHWNRAIPEAGYITLGTIRYGVKLAKPKKQLIQQHTTPSTLSSLSLTTSSAGDDNRSIESVNLCIDHSANGINCSAASNSSINSSNNSSNRATVIEDNKNCCCIGTTDIVMPWNADCVRSRLPVSTNLINNSKNRTLSTSSSSIATQRTAQPVGGCLVIGNRDSSPPTCCYTTSNSTKIPNIFNAINNKSSTNACPNVHRTNDNSNISKTIIKNNNNDRATTDNNDQQQLRSSRNVDGIDTIKSNELLVVGQSGPTKKISPSVLPLTLIKRNAERDPLVQCNDHHYDINDLQNDCVWKDGNGVKASAKNLNNNDKLNSFQCCAPAYTIQQHQHQHFQQQDHHHTASAADTTDQIQRFVSSVKDRRKHYNHDQQHSDRDQYYHNKRYQQYKSTTPLVDPAAIIQYGYMSPSKTLCHQDHQDKEFPIVRKLTRKLLVSRTPSIQNTNIIIVRATSSPLPETSTTTTSIDIASSSTLAEKSDNDDGNGKGDQDINSTNAVGTIGVDNNDNNGGDNNNKNNVADKNNNNNNNNNDIIIIKHNNVTNDQTEDNDDLIFIDSSNSQFSSSTSEENLSRSSSSKNRSIKTPDIFSGIEQSPVYSASHSIWSSDCSDSFNDHSVSDRCDRDTISINNNRKSTTAINVEQLHLPIKQKQPNNPIVFIADEEEDIDFENKSIPIVSKQTQSQGSLSHSIATNIGYRRIKEESVPKPLNYFGKNPTYNRLLPAPIMEKRRNTLDRWQRLGFGKRNSSSNSSDGKNNQPKENKQRGVEKTERLRELTEMLKRTRAPAATLAAAPVPPPRKLRSTIETQSSSSSLSIDNNKSELSETKNDVDAGYPMFLFCTPNQSNKLAEPVGKSFEKSSDILRINVHDRDSASSKSSSVIPILPSAIPSVIENTLNDTMPNVITLMESNVDETNEIPIPATAGCSIIEKEDDLFTALPKMESRTIIGAYTQKNIPFRSASFSQVDYSSGKYIRSAINAFKSNLNKQKNPSVVENTNLTLPRKRCTTKDHIDAANKDDRLISFNPEATSAFEVIRTNSCGNPASERIQENVIEESEQEIAEESLQQNIDQSLMISDKTEYICLDKLNDLNTLKNERQFIDGLNVVQAAEMILDGLCEEELALSTSPNQNVFQTATQCLIPVPVYECAAQDWNDNNTTDQWIDVCEDDSAKIIEELNVSFDKISEIVKDPSELVVNTTTSIIPDDHDELPDNNDIKVHSSHEEVITSKVENSTLSAVSEIPELDELELNDQVPEQIPLSIESEQLLPAISITSNCWTEQKEPLKTNANNLTVEIVEVRKRHSNDGRTEKSADSSMATNDTNRDQQHSNSEDRRRIDKSKRRKGIYIQWPAIDKDNKISVTDDWISPTKDSLSTESGTSIWDCSGKPSAELDIATPITTDTSNITTNTTTPTTTTTTTTTITTTTTTDDIDLSNCCDFSSISANKLEKLNNESIIGWIACKTPDDDSHTPISIEPTTPESDSNRMVWPKSLRKQSLTCQSSEEKDETNVIDSTPNTIRNQNQNQKIHNLLRYESVSDNESDRTSPRGRASQSPASSDQDLKRYSKRPLRGPYGQMLEAEMKKPAKLHYDEILEELNRSDSPSRSKDLPCNTETTRLPVPYHARASSTPIRTELVPKDNNHNHRRFPSSVDSTTSTRNNIKNFGFDKCSSRKVSSCDVSEKSVKKSDHEKSLSKAMIIDDVRLTQSVRNLSDKNLVMTKGQLQASPALLAELLKGSSEKLLSEQIGNRSVGGTVVSSASPALPTAVLKCLDTRTHVVVELYNTEQSYVESLETIVSKYLNPLKSPEYASIVDAQMVDEIFLMVPSILNIHERFLDDLRRRLDAWEPLQKVGDAFVEVFSKTYVLDTYTSFVNNWNRAKDAIRATSNSRPSFARFLETMAREHKGKLTLDNLLIKPVQKFPNYELILSRLIKHTDIDHPDQKPLQEALKLVHDILLHLNCKEREALENDQREAALRELEGVIEGINDLVTNERQFLLFDLVSMPSGQAGRKDRGFFLFSDLLVITSIKRRSGTIRKPNISCPGSVASTLDTNKYKLLMKISIEDLEIVKAKDENVRKIIKEIENLSDDFNKLQQILEITSNLRCNHQMLEETIKELQRDVQKQLSDKQTNDSQLNLLELTLNTPSSVQQLAVVFSKPIKRTQWEQTFVEAKQKLAASMERHPVPEFLASIPIRKTRAGLQFTCAAPTLGQQRDVWVCNSDGYVGQVCVLSLMPEPTVTSCNGVCNARILCVASVPANGETSMSRCISISIEDTTSNATQQNHSSSDIEQSTKIYSSTSQIQSDNIQLDSSSSSDDSDNENQTDCSIAIGGISGGVGCAGISSTSYGHSQIATQLIDLNADDLDSQQSTMWLGTEDGCIHVYNCTDNIRIKKNKIKIQHISAVYSILYLDNRVFVSLSNGDIVVYLREQNGWNTTSPLTVTIGNVTSPVTRLTNVHGKLWCSIQGVVKILNSITLQIENQIQISTDSKPITNMAVSGNYVWISIQNSAYIKCFHSNSYEFLFEVNLAPPVNKMLSNCDDIIRQHKAACLRVTSLLACKDLVWVGTSAGVLLTISTLQATLGGNSTASPIVTGIPFGHTGHVRFLTCVDYGKLDDSAKSCSTWLSKSKVESTNTLIISGGDGYEDFRNTGINPLSEVAGREDSTNHLLLWQV